MTQDLTTRFLDGMSRAATFVAVATTDGEAGRHGVTVSSLTSLSTEGEQPSLLICVHHLSNTANAILQNRRFCANLLGEAQQDLSNLFAGRDGVDGSDRFEALAWEAGPLGQPVLAGASANFECSLATAVLWESHYIIVGQVTSVWLSGDPSVLLYGQRAYRKAVQLGSD